MNRILRSFCCLGSAYIVNDENRRKDDKVAIGLKKTFFVVDGSGPK
jgi:hypothetical protein